MQHEAADAPSNKWLARDRAIPHSKAFWLTGAAFLLFCGVVLTGWYVRGTTSGSSGHAQLAFAVLAQDPLFAQSDDSEVVAWNLDSGRVASRWATEYKPSIAASPDGVHVYILDTEWTHVGTESSGVERLQMVDGKDGSVLASSTRPVGNGHDAARVEYTTGNQAALSVSPGGKLVLVYSTNMNGKYWFDLYDATTLEYLGETARIHVPDGCGGSGAVSVGMQVVVLCGATKEGNADGMITTPLALHFINVESRSTIGTVPLPDTGLYPKGKPLTIVPSVDRTKVLVVTNDFMVWEVDVASRTLRIYLRLANRW